MLGAEGAVLFLERVSPALEHVDSSSGAIGTAVYHAIEAFAPIIAAAPADPKTRRQWLIGSGQLTKPMRSPSSKHSPTTGEKLRLEGVASHWADELLDITRMALSPDPKLHGFFHGTSACLSACTPPSATGDR